MGFWPYLRHAHMSDDEPSAGTWQTTFFTWFFLECAAETALAVCKYPSFQPPQETVQRTAGVWRVEALSREEYLLLDLGTEPGTCRPLGCALAAGAGRTWGSGTSTAVTVDCRCSPAAGGSVGVGVGVVVGRG
jgi:hypothetical protein